MNDKPTCAECARYTKYSPDMAKRMEGLSTGLCKLAHRTYGPANADDDYCGGFEPRQLKPCTGIVRYRSSANPVMLLALLIAPVCACEC